MDDFKYKISQWWASFTYIWRRPYYKYKLLKRIGRHWFPGPWDLSEFMYSTCFEIFCEYYECVEPFKWPAKSSDPNIHIICDEMTYLYNWYTKYLPQEKENCNYLHDIWWNHYNQGLKDFFLDPPHGLYLQNLCKHLIHLHMEEEQRIYDEEELNFKRLITIRRYLTD